MRTINFLQFGREPILKQNSHFSMECENTGGLMDQKEYEVRAILKDVAFTDIALRELKNFYDFDVFSIIEDGRVLFTEEDYPA